MRTLCAWRWLSIFFFFLSFFSCVLVRLFDYFFSCFACAIFLFVFIVGVITRRRRECVSTNRFSKFNELQLASINLWIIENTHFELLKQTQCMVLDMRLSHLARNTNSIRTKSSGQSIANQTARNCSIDGVWIRQQKSSDVCHAQSYYHFLFVLSKRSGLDQVDRAHYHFFATHFRAAHLN